MLGEKGVGYEPVRESPWQRRDEFIDLNPTGQTPVMVDVERGVALIDSTVICEFFEETVGKASMLNGSAVDRAEIRRLVIWFDEHFYRDITAPLLHERMLKRLVYKQSPDGTALRNAMKAAVAHLDYIDYLLDHRTWLGGATMSLADLAAAAQISIADYLGGIDWKSHEQAKRWYVGMKSRPTFRPLLAERMEGIPPPADYEKLDL
jgi:glutathione S-transferase